MLSYQCSDKLPIEKANIRLQNKKSFATKQLQSK